jgi:hyaluronate lyase
VVLIYDALTPTQLANFMAGTQKFTPLGTASPVIGLTTGANRVWEVMVVALRSMLLKRPDDLTAARSAFSPVFDDVTSGDGFYADGSFIQHLKHPYTGSYGVSLLGSLASGMHWLADSTWEVSDPDAANIYRWVRDSFEPLVYRGAFMDMVRGREISRSGSPDHAAGQAVIGSVLRLAEFAATAQAAELKSVAKYWMQTDTFHSFTSTAGLPILLLGKSMLSNATVVPKPELLGHWNFSSMDRVVHRQVGWGLGLSMRSSRIFNYESINGENLKGWFTGDGATWLYNSDLGQFNDFWPTVNPYRLPGTTVDTLPRADSSGQSTSNTMTWVGGVTLPIGYGAAGMDFAGCGVSLTARKSWFMFDDEVVALGSGINSTDNRTIETIVENRKLSAAGTEAFTVDGVAQSTKLGWSSTLGGAHWCQLAGVAGYYFPGGANVKALREARTGSWSLVNTGGSTTTLTRNYLTLWFDHGSNPANASYAYAILPNKTASETATYAGAPQFQVLENSPEAQGVRETSLGVEAVNFWTDNIRTVGAITCDRKASVLTQERPGQIDLAVSDPTQTNAGTIIVELARPAGAVLAVSPGITVLQLSPTIRARINVNGANGRTFTATLKLAANAPAD